MAVRPAQTQISLGIRPVWSESSKAWVLSYHWAHSENSDQTWRCPGWSESSLREHSFCWVCHVVAHMYILYDEESDQKSDMMAQLVICIKRCWLLFYSIHGISTFCSFKLIKRTYHSDTAYQGTFAREFSDNYLTMQVIWSRTDLNQPLTHLEPFLITLYD